MDADYHSSAIPEAAPAVAAPAAEPAEPVADAETPPGLAELDEFVEMA